MTKYTFSDLAVIYINYYGETFILRIVILKRNLTTRAYYGPYKNAEKSTNSLCAIFL